jgi:hypothetical protein
MQGITEINTVSQQNLEMFNLVLVQHLKNSQCFGTRTAKNAALFITVDVRPAPDPDADPYLYLLINICRF